MTHIPVLDHIVINVRTRMEECEAIFRDLGFTLTPRGYHSLGSINALAIFGTDYLELLGVPADKPEVRPELSQAPVGWNGLVFKTDDADATHAHLKSLGIAAEPPKSFSRPVTLADGTSQDAKFRTVTLPPDVYPAGRLYFCEHETPELIWRREWQSHPNGAAAVRQMTIISENPEARAKQTADILQGERADATTLRCAHGFVLKVMTPDAYRDAYGELAMDLHGRVDAFGAVEIASSTPSSAVNQAGSAGLRTDTNADGGGHILIEPFDTLLTMTPAGG